jgi:cation diffusion facilitator CzcD-associated flavoprotein CzcO
MDRALLRIAIVGAGPGGLCTGKRLLDEGFEDFVILERAPDLGGTWNWNRYPGAECDVPSVLYSFSFDFKTDWSKPYATQPEILGYLHDFADKFGLRKHIRCGDGVARACWDDASASWTLTLDSGTTVDADVVVSAIGMFNEPAWPAIEGLDRFEGASWHSARWNHNYDLTGARVAVIGSAASAVQLVPEVVKVAGRVYLFQRTANWVNPKLDDPYTPEQIEQFREDPSILWWFREQTERSMNEGMTFAIPERNAESEAAGLAAIETVRDPDIRAELRPTHPFGCKRPLFSNVYYAAFNEPNLELVTDPIDHITAHAVVTAGGFERAVDVIVVATGFETTKYLAAIDVAGRDGRGIADAWNDGPIAYLGVMTAGFPNLFMCYGPNTNNGSILTMIEFQVEYLLAHLRRFADDDISWVDVKPEAMQRYNDEVQDAIAGVRVWQAGCNTYYRSPSGRIVTQWPYSMDEYRARTATLDHDAFEVGRLSTTRRRRR